MRDPVEAKQQREAKAGAWVTHDGERVHLPSFRAGRDALAAKVTEWMNGPNPKLFTELEEILNG